MENFKQKALHSFWGFKTGFNPIKVDGSLLNLYRYLTTLDLDYSLNNENMTLDSIKDATKAFFARHFSVHPVLHIDNNRKDKICKHLMNKDLSVANITEAINAYADEISPFDIPILLRNGGHLGAINEVTFLSLDFLNAYKIPTGYNQIALEYPYISLTPIAYTHEITHTQMALNKGKNVTNLHNNEVISIFMEKLHAYETDPKVFIAIEKDRLKEIKYLIGSLYVPLESRKADANKMSLYIVSSLIAENLFNMYLEAPNSGKALLLDYIKDVIEGKRNLEQLLYALEIDFERSKSPEFIEANLSL